MCAEKSTPARERKNWKTFSSSDVSQCRMYTYRKDVVMRRIKRVWQRIRRRGKKSFKLSLFQREKYIRRIFHLLFTRFYVCVSSCTLIYLKSRALAFRAIQSRHNHSHSPTIIHWKILNWIKPISTFYMFFISIDDNGMTLTTSCYYYYCCIRAQRSVFSDQKGSKQGTAFYVFHPLRFFPFEQFSFFYFSSVLPSSHFPSIWMRITTASSFSFTLCPGSPSFFCAATSMQCCSNSTKEGLWIRNYEILVIIKNNAT